jgi:hypothetical protein
MPKCIYCLEDKTVEEFNIEHVIPQSFGSFENNFTLTETVCVDCNQYFGNELELSLGRDTYEGLLRYIYKVKASKAFKFLNNKRLLFRLKEKGPWEGAIVQFKYSEEQNEVVVDPINQVGLQKRGGGEWEFFEIKDIRSKDDLEGQGFIVKGERTLKFLFKSTEQLKEMREQLGVKGFKVETLGEEKMPLESNEKEINIEIRGTIDRVIHRAIAKIAFNYLAYQEGRDFVLGDNFNEIRIFVRYGEHRDVKQRLVTIQKEPILYPERRFGLQETNGHMITLEWNASKTSLTSQVTLFNEIVYRIILCRYYWGVYREIATGHHFDLESKKISKLTTFPKAFYIP